MRLLGYVLIAGSVHAEEPLIVAHRGASLDAPENTLPAFRLAWEQGADAVEGDFHLTKDGHIVCIHDNNTKRVSNRNLAINASTLAELRALDVGAYRGDCFKGTVIPTIAEVFSTVPDGKKIYIEIKCGVEIIPGLIGEIRKSGLEREQIVVISFAKPVVREMKAKAPEYKVCWLSNLKRDRSGNMNPSLETVLASMKQMNADGFSSSKDQIDEGFIKSVMKEGYEYHVWTVNDARTARRFKDWGARSITTDFPETMRNHLAEETVSPRP